MRSEAFLWLVRGAGFAFGATVVISILYGLTLAVQALLIVLLALLLASALGPVVDWLRARTSLGRASGVLLVYAGFFVSVIVIALLIVPGAIGQFSSVRRSAASSGRCWPCPCRLPYWSLSNGCRPAE